MPMQIWNPPPCPEISRNALDSHHFDHFRHMSVHILGGLEDHAVGWILSRCGEVASVRHAILALSGRHLAYDPYRPAAASVYSLRHYSAAISLVKQHLELQAQESSIPEILAACFLLIAYEILGGDSEGEIRALAHLEGALSVLKLSENASLEGSTASTRDLCLIFRHLFTRLDLLAVTYVGTRLPMLPGPRRSHVASLHPMQTPDSLACLQDALSELEYDAMHLIKVEANGLRYLNFLPDQHPAADPARWVSAVNRRDALLRRLRQWHNSMGASIGDRIQWPKERLQELLRLKCRYLATMISTWCCLNPNETCYDRYHSEFRQLIALADDYLQSEAALRPAQRLHPRFTLDAGVVYPLYLTALKCRVWEVRRRALGLLERSGREGPWDGTLMARIGQHVMELEQRLAGGFATDIPESVRVHSTAINVDRSQRLVYVECRVRRQVPLGTSEEVWTIFQDLIKY